MKNELETIGAQTRPRRSTVRKINGRWEFTPGWTWKSPAKHSAPTYKVLEYLVLHSRLPEAAEK